MLSYKNWKVINESIDGSTNLGLTQTPAIGVVGSQTRSEEELLAEMKKKMAACKSKMKKKMDGYAGDEEVDDEDGEVVKPKEKKDGDVDADKEAELDSEDGEKDDDSKEKDDDLDDDEEMDDDAEAGDDDERSYGRKKDLNIDDSGEATEFMMKKKMKKGDKKGKGKKVPKEIKKNDEMYNKDKKAKGKPEVRITKEEKEAQEWRDSVANMLGVSDIDKKSWDGFTRVDTKAGEPAPGEVGFAPQQKVGH